MLTRNIVIFFMSIFRDNAVSTVYSDESGLFKAECLHTNETALKYIEWKLASANERIDAVYAIVSKEVAGSGFQRFKEIFKDRDFKIVPVPLQDNGSLEGSFSSICDMYDMLEKELAGNCRIRVHLDMTGGFRHSNVLMLAMLRLMQYAGAESGIVTYTNYQNRIVEEAGDLIDIFSLLGGAEEFASFGNVEQIQRYFRKIPDKSIYLENLLNQMQNYSDAIRVCSQFEDVSEALNMLKQSVELYKNMLNMGISICEQEKLFAKLLPVIEKDYADVLAAPDSLQRVPYIIRWCAGKGLLQQAYTMYTEWLPVYFTECGIIKIINNNVTKECLASGKMWSNWQTHLLRNYRPDVYGSEAAGELLYEDFRRYTDSDKSAAELQNMLKGRNAAVDSFFQHLMEFSLQASFNNPLKLLKQLPEDDLIKMIVKASAPGNKPFGLFVEDRLKKTGSMDRFIITCIRMVPRNYITQWFGLSYDDKNPASRREYFKMMLKHGDIKTCIGEEKLLKIVADYSDIVKRRNSFNHAVVSQNELAGEKSFTEMIISNTDYIISCGM